MKKQSLFVLIQIYDEPRECPVPPQAKFPKTKVQDYYPNEGSKSYWYLSSASDWLNGLYSFGLTSVILRFFLGCGMSARRDSFSPMASIDGLG